MLAWKPVRKLRVLDFDIETVAAGFADPEWVPQKVTCIAWSWIGERTVHVRTRDEDDMLDAFLAAYNTADMVTGHNIVRFDLPILNSEILRSERTPLSPKLAQDTIKIVRTKGFKKGQDNLGHLLHLREQKKALSWQQWQDAYDEPGWATVRERCASDVRQHKVLRQEMIQRGWLRAPAMWRP